MKDDQKTKKQLVDELTELRSQNAALKKSESPVQYQSLIENLRDVIYELDSQGVVLYISPAVRDMLGYDSTEIVGKNFIELAYKDDLSRLTEWFSELHKGIESPSEYRISDKSGEFRWARTKTRPIMEDGLFKGARGILIDITAQRRIEEALRESEEKYRLSFENVADVIYTIDTNLNVLSVSPSMERILGYKPQDFLGRPATDLAHIFTPESFEQAIADISLILKGKTIAATIYRFIAKDGTIKYGEVSGSPVMSDGKIIGIISVARDITDRKQVEERLLESEEKYRWVLDNITDVITVMDMNLRFTYVSPSIKRMRGYTVEEAVAQTFEQVMTPESLQISAKVFEEEMHLEASGTADPGRIRIVEVEQYRKDGSIVLMENHLSFMRDEAKKAVGIISVSHDITLRKRAEEALKETNETLDAIIQSAPLAIIALDPDGNVTRWNPTAEKMFGWPENEVLGHPLPYVSEDQRDEHLKLREHVLRGEGFANVEVRRRKKDGSSIDISVSTAPLRDSQGRVTGAMSLNSDITDRKRVEGALKESENKYRLLADNVSDVIFVLDMNLNYTYVSPSVKILRGYKPEEVLKQQPSEILAPSSLDLAMSTLSEIMALVKNERSDIPVSKTLDLEMIRKDGTTVWTEVKFSFIRDQDKRPIGILGLTRDITKRKRAEEELQRTLESLRKSFGATIQAMVSAVESRDPYTAGHQIRSANLARCIATEMGLSKEKIEGIRMAGSIHDIGKLSIPAEILSKPTKLTNIEFSLIKEHSQKGYEMLKDVESPWPLAEIVYQHHERMDGTGYPRNLKGEDILMEARILAVSDVVESMASHRPYRPAIGIKAALEEIEKNRGILYDDAVADACLRLFREKGFQLEGA